MEHPDVLPHHHLPDLLLLYRQLAFRLREDVPEVGDELEDVVRVVEMGGFCLALLLV